MTDKHIALEVSRDEHYKSPYLKSLKENWPSLARDYRHYCHNFHPKTGEVWTWTSPEGQRFFHLILDEKGQEMSVDGNRLQSFKKALKNLKRVTEDDQIKTIELPRVGFHFSDHEFELAQSLLKEMFMDTSTEIKFV